MSRSQPSIIFVRQSGQRLQAANWPVVLFLLECLVGKAPIGRQAEQELSITLRFCSLRYSHGQIAHAAR